MTRAADDCSAVETHTACPSGYFAWHEWAERMSKTHEQRLPEVRALGDLGEAMTGRDRLLLIAAGVALVAVTVAALLAASVDGVGAPVATVASTTTAPPGATIAAVPTTTTTTTVVGTAVSEPHHDDRLVVVSADRAAVEDVTRRFVAAWLSPQSGRAQHLGTVASADFAPQVAEIPDDALPAAHLEALVDTQTDGRQAYVHGRLSDGSGFVVYVVATADGWRVASLDED